ncbi:MAG: 1-acyl-sn-glycerol-3-phosphate acyltransferase [Sphingopyxis sp.]|nr:1-acyl-sn-glycerol-3-phosphate acyltransferase [Sphingopyxis sp.]
MSYLVAVLRSGLFWLGFVLCSSSNSIAAVLAMPFSRRAVVASVRGWSRWHRWLCRFVLGQRIVIEGDMPDGPYLYVFKHESAFETIEQPLLFKHPAVFAKEQLFNVPVWGQAAAFYGLIPVDRDGGSKAMRAILSAARAALDEGRPLVLFAEGTRVPRGSAPPLRAGFAGIYRMLGVPVIPVAVDSGDANPPRQWVKYPRTITYKVGDIIEPGLPREEAEERVRVAINALNPPEALLNQ